MDEKNEKSAFGPIGFKKDVDALYDALSADDIKTSNDIIRSMGEKKNILAVEPLIILLEYDDASVRSNAALALGRIGDMAAVDPLIKALKDPSILVQTGAAWSLGELGDEKAIEPLELMDISKETPALMNMVRKSINRIRNGGVVDEKLYLMAEASPGLVTANERKEGEHAIAPKIGSTAIGMGGKAMIVAGLAIAVILIIIVGAFAYTMLFPPVWSERLPLKNSTGQYQAITVFRNATDPTGVNLTKFLNAENESIKGAMRADTGDKCVEYAARLHDDAERARINCSVIGTELRGDAPGHALVAFNTKDMGPVYVDPWTTNASGEDFGGISGDRIIFLRDSWTQTLPVINPMNISVHVVDYRNASPITYDRLMAFLSNDSTETALYVDPTYTCTDFAARLHDTAEAQGIKSGIVVIGFTNTTIPGHCFNAFPTADKGIIYIDDTGINASMRENGGLSTDAVVYLRPGLDLGELPANQTGGDLSYDFYLQRKEKLDAYNDEWTVYQDDVGYYMANKSYYNEQLSQYNKDKGTYEGHVGQYNTAVDQYNAGTGSNTLGDLNAWHDRLLQEKSNLDKSYNTLDNLREYMEAWRQNLLSRYDGLISREEAKWYINHPVGIVKDVEIFW